jgi:putative endonuclease
MFTVYVLFSKTYKKIYIGFTSNLELRIQQHNETAIKGYTIKYRPWEVLFTEEFENKLDAMKREKQLKGGQGREFIWNEIRKRGLISA